MPKGRVKILKANDCIMLETVVGKGYRIQIPKALQSLFNPNDLVVVTLKRKEV